MPELNNHVVFVTQRYPPDQGGNASRIHDTAVHLADLGWEVTVLTPPPSFPPGEFDRSWSRATTDVTDQVTVHRLWTWQPLDGDPGVIQRVPYFLVFALHAFVWLIWNRRSYDVIVSSTPPISTGLPALFLRPFDIPWVVDVRDLWIDNAVSLGYITEGGLLERVSRSLQDGILHHADRIAVTTSGLREMIASRYGAELRAKTIHLPNGVDVDRFDATAGDDESTVIYTGNLGRAQDLECAVEAMAHVETDDAVLKLVGSGNAEPDLKRLAADLELNGSIEFVGLVPREEIPDLLDEASIGLAPLKDTDELAYAMPTKVYEYLSSGLPTVVAGQGEIERFIDRSGGGVHVDNDPRQLADQIDSLLADADQRSTLGERGRRYVSEQYDRGQIANRLGEELMTLAQTDQRGAT